MKQDYTHITVLLDRSGSMASVQTDTIGGFNRFLNAHQREKGDCSVSLHQFDDEFETVYKMKPVGDAPELDDRTFVPRGSTALLAAIGKAIDDTGAALKRKSESQRPSKVIFVILTDGLENASGRVTWGESGRTRSEINAKVKHQREVYKWEFIYIGANQDAIHEAKSFGIDEANAINYTANAEGTQAVHDSLADNTVRYRSGAAVCCSFSAEDREAQEKAKE